MFGILKYIVGYFFPNNKPPGAEKVLRLLEICGIVLIFVGEEFTYST